MSAAEREATVFALEATGARLKRAILAIGEPLIALDKTLAEIEANLQAIFDEIERETTLGVNGYQQGNEGA